MAPTPEMRRRTLLIWGSGTVDHPTVGVNSSDEFQKKGDLRGLQYMVVLVLFFSPSSLHSKRKINMMTFEVV